MAVFNPLPYIGDIVWCNFPEAVSPTTPGPKPRPGIVMNVIASKHVVMIAYGTSQKTQRLFAGEFLIDKQLLTAGLSYPTKFDLSRLQLLTFDTTWFSQAPGVGANVPPPKLGIVPPAFIPVMRQAWIQLKQARTRETL